METTRSEVLPPAYRSVSSRFLGADVSGWLGQRRSFVIAGVAIAASAVPAVWVALTDPARLLFFLPCAVMMFMCMKGMSQESQVEATLASPPSDTPAATTSQD